MGNEVRCRVELGAETAEDAKVLLETEELIIRGPLRAKIAVRDARDVVASDGILQLTWNGQRVRIHAAREAAKWAEKIRNPKSVLDKLGVNSGQRASLVDFPDDAFAAALAARGVDVSKRTRKGSDLIFFGANRREDLIRLRELRDFLVADGAFWIIRPKGIAAITENEVREAAIEAGFVDVKVVRFSETYTAEKFVIPLAKR